MDNRCRHGDVVLVKVDSLPEGAKSLGDRKILAFGEKTGHKHEVDLGEMFETKDGKLYLKVDKLAKVSHEEHVTKTIEPGIYYIGIKRQYSSETGQWSRVAD